MRLMADNLLLAAPQRDIRLGKCPTSAGWPVGLSDDEIEVMF